MPIHLLLQLSVNRRPQLSDVSARLSPNGSYSCGAVLLDGKVIQHKRNSNNVLDFLQSEGYIRFKADSEASSKAIYEAYQRWCEDNAQKPMSANRISSELAQNERLYNVESTNNVYSAGKRVRGFIGVEVLNLMPY